MADERQNFKNMTAIKMVKEGLKKGISETVQKHWFKRLIVLFLAFSLGFGIGIYQCYKHIKGGKEAPKTTNLSVVASTPTEKPFTLTISHVNEIIRPASELITTKYAYTDANIYENYKELFNVRLPITTNKVVFTYSGSVGIGIDLSKVSLYLDNENKHLSKGANKIVTYFFVFNFISIWWSTYLFRQQNSWKSAAVFPRYWDYPDLNWRIWHFYCANLKYSKKGCLPFGKATFLFIIFFILPFYKFPPYPLLSSA